MAVEPAERYRPPDGEEPPLISQSVAVTFAAFGLLASLGMGWILARSSSGLPPFQLPGRTAPAPAGAQAPMIHLVSTDLKFDQTNLKVAPGTVRVSLENKGAIEHDFTIDSPRAKLLARPGKTAESEVKLDKPGTYPFYCSIPGHREAGMVGKITVEAGAAPATSTSNAKDAKAAPAVDAHASHATTVSTQSKGNQVMVPRLEGDVKVFELNARAVQWEVLPGVLEEAWVYNDQLPGPMFRVTEGDKIKVIFKNNLPEPSVVHFHGPRLPNSQDGVPDVTQPVVPVGGSFTYQFTAEPAGTFVYHSHHNTAVQEPMGLYGVMIIDPKPDSAQARRDAEYARDYIQVVGEFGGYFTVNGKAFPATDVLEAKVGEKVRIRLVNLGQAAHPMHLHGYHFRIVGTDGYPVEGPPLIKDTISVSPGERYDLEFVADNPGTWVFHCHILSHVTNQGVEPGGMLTVIKVT